jgi:multidrug resistance efflux pump
MVVKKFNVRWSTFSLTFTLGDQVKSGQLLLEFEDNLDLETQKVQKQIEALEATYSDATSGTDIESINSAKIEIARINGNIELAAKNRDRNWNRHRITCPNCKAVLLWHRTTTTSL